MLRSGLLLLSIFFSPSVFSQQNTSVGMEGAATFDNYDYIDNGVLLKKGTLLTAYYGITFRGDIIDRTFMELGIFRKHYDEGVGFRNSPGYTSTNAFDAWYIAVRLGTRINLHREKLFLVPVIGYGRINSDFNFGEAYLSGSSISNSDTISYNVRSTGELSGGFPLIQTGIGIETKIRSTLSISLSANYFTGFRNVIEQDIQYMHNRASFSAKGLSKGEFFALSLGIKYPFVLVSGKKLK